MEKAILNRATLLLGNDTMERIRHIRVIVFGVGGVGSWCVESLVRSGVRHITIVDGDRVCVSNINRQLMATTATIGRTKVEAMKEHLLTVNPEAVINARCDVFTADTAADFHLDTYDYIVDAIDSLADKALLIEMATRTHARFYSSMGAALKLDPTRVKTGEFWSVKGCPLARALRQRFKKSSIRPARKFQCVYSDELVPNRGSSDFTDACDADRPRVNGSLMHITAIFGLTLAGMILRHISIPPTPCPDHIHEIQ